LSAFPFLGNVIVLCPHYRPKHVTVNTRVHLIMFKFNFDMDDLDSEFGEIFVASTQRSLDQIPIELQHFSEIPISRLVRAAITPNCLL
jgi:hypothetical protein